MAPPVAGPDEGYYWLLNGFLPVMRCAMWLITLMLVCVSSRAGEASHKKRGHCRGPRLVFLPIGAQLVPSTTAGVASSESGMSFGAKDWMKADAN